MEVMRTFAVGLFAMKYKRAGGNILDTTLRIWGEPSYLFKFFEEHEGDLEFSKLNSIEEAVKRTREEHNLLRDALLSLASDDSPPLDSFFRPLNNTEAFDSVQLSKQKLRYRKGILRLYAIRIEPNVYVVTGGAIKLTRNMDERPHTAKALADIELCRAFLRANHIDDIDSLHELIIEV